MLGCDRHLLPGGARRRHALSFRQIGLDPATGQLVEGIENRSIVFSKPEKRGKGWWRIARRYGQAHSLSDRPVAFRPRQRDHARYFDKPYPARAVVGGRGASARRTDRGGAILVLQG